MPKLVRPEGQSTEVDAIITVFGRRGHLTVLRHLAQHGPSYRRDIVTATGLPAPTVGAYLALPLAALAVIVALLPEGTTRLIWAMAVYLGAIFVLSISMAIDISRNQRRIGALRDELDARARGGNFPGR